MAFRVLFTDAAARDLEDIYDYLAGHDSPARANHVLGQIERVIQSLSEFPHRGNCPRELLLLGVREFRETFFKPYRIIYRVVDETVYIYLIADGRRDMQSLLAKRLLEI